MRDKKTAIRDALPENFTTLEDFWEFWDTHSSADYEDTMEAVVVQDQDIDLTNAPEITPEMFAKAVVRRGLPSPPSKLPYKIDPL
jgi:hypothetical protein